jgi:hypothetical protein
MIYSSRQPKSHIAFTDSNDRLTSLTPASDDPGWKDMITTDAIWITGVYNSDGDITSLTTDSWGEDGSFNLTSLAWSGGNGYCENDGGSPPNFQTWRLLVAYSLPAADGVTPIITQVLSKDQVVVASVELGAAALLPWDVSGMYPL